MSRILSVALLVCLAAPAFGQGMGLGIPGDANISVPSALTASVGGTLTIPVTVTSSTNDVLMVAFDVSCDVAQLTITGATPSPGLEQHITDNGLPPTCDIMITPGQSMVMMFLAVPYNIPTYGDHFFDVHLSVAGTTPGTTTDVSFMAMTAAVPAPMTTTVTIAGAGDPMFMRGDVNADASCNISDAVSLLSFMFSSGTTPACMDGADVNDDGSVTIADPVRLLAGLFGSAPPVEEGCHIDAIATDTLDCQNSSCP